MQVTKTNLNGLTEKEMNWFNVMLDSTQMDPEVEMISSGIIITRFCSPLCWLQTRARYPGDSGKDGKLQSYATPAEQQEWKEFPLSRQHQQLLEFI